MTIAWFRHTAPDAADPLDDTAAMLQELRASHAIELFTESNAHDFVWRHFLTPWDLCVYELDHTRAHQFVWGYLLNYPGVVMLKSPAVQNSWGGSDGREPHQLEAYMAGFRFDASSRMPGAIGIPLLASRVVVVSHAALAESLREAYPDARIRYAPPTTSNVRRSVPRAESDRCRVGVLDHNRLDVVERACDRARAAGAAVELLASGSAASILEACDIVVALTWPPAETSLTPALVGMAAAKPVVTLEIERTADWPAIDAQTGRPRGIMPTGTPIAVTLDPRDEEHSLMLAIRRLAADAGLRETLGDAARVWWQANAAPLRAAAAWNQILAEAVSLAPPGRPPEWPRHLGGDGTELARSILDEFGLTSDL